MHRKTPALESLFNKVAGLNPTQDGPFRGFSRIGGESLPPPSFCTHILQWWNFGTVTLYLKKIQKIYESRDAPLEFCRHQHFFTLNQQISLYQEIQIQPAFWYVISNSFNFFWVQKDVFNNHGYNFNNVSKNGYSRLSWSKGILKKTLWRHHFCP